MGADNGDGLLVAETVDGVETVFTWDLAPDVPQVLATSDGTKNLYGLRRIGLEQGGAWRYPLPDALGSVRQWTDPAGAVLGLQSYGPFGQPRGPVGTPPWGFTGEWQDPAGMVYLRARWYNPALGRFTQVDPLPGMPNTPATLHPYTYALDRPLQYADPSGRFPPEVIMKYLENTYPPYASLYYEAWSSDAVFWDMLVTAEVGDSLFSPFVGSGVFTAGEPFGFVGERDLCAYQGHGPYELRRGPNHEVVESEYMRKGGAPMSFESGSAEAQGWQTA